MAKKHFVWAGIIAGLMASSAVGGIYAYNRYNSGAKNLEPVVETYCMDLGRNGGEVCNLLRVKGKTDYVYKIFVGSNGLIKDIRAYPTNEPLPLSVYTSEPSRTMLDSKKGKSLEESAK